MHLHTLGEALITVGEAEIRPTAPMMFAALLVLGAERGRRIHRLVLQDMLFGKNGKRGTAHALRQLLYKLKRLGAPVQSDSATLWIAIEDVEDAPFSESDHNCAILPDYEGLSSRRFAEWLEVYRATRQAVLRSALLKNLEGARQDGDIMQIERLASALLRIDPLNVDGTLARAEALDVRGRKHDALLMLSQYAREVESAPEVRQAALTLRRRIADRSHLKDEARSMFGRSADLAWLLANFSRAQGGTPTVSVLWGEPGIGKTRLMDEYALRMRLTNAQIQVVRCQEGDAQRPLGALNDLLPQLLATPGSLAVSPESMSVLRMLTNVADSSHVAEQPLERHGAAVVAAIQDLLASIGAELPLVMLVDDAQWLDRRSLFLLTGFHTLPTCVHVVLASRSVSGSDLRVSENTFTRKLAPLGRSDAAALLAASLPDQALVDTELLNQCLDIGAGNPLFLHTIAEYLRVHGRAPDNDSTLRDLLGQRVMLLSPGALLLLRIAAILGPFSTDERMRVVGHMDDGDFLLSVQELTDVGFLSRTSETLECSHDLVRQAAFSTMARALLVTLCSRAAVKLEEDGAGTSHPMLWAAAEAWIRAEEHQKAAAAFTQCAKVAMALGEPVFACTACGQAQALLRGNADVDLLKTAVISADIAGDSALVLENVARYRRFEASNDVPVCVHDWTELPEIYAMLRQEQWRPDMRRRLLDCITAFGPDTSHRQRAMRLLLAVAEQDFAYNEAATIQHALETLRHDATDNVASRHLTMVYHIVFGDVDTACREATALWPMLHETPTYMYPRVLGNVARAFVVAGSMNDAIAATMESHSLAVKISSAADISLETARLCDYYLLMGNVVLARHWCAQAEALLQQIGCRDEGLHLTNSIWLALIDGDYSSAHTDLKHLGSLGSARSAHGRRAVTAYRILLSYASGAFDPSLYDLEELELIDNEGRKFCEHHIFALALFLAHHASGNVETAVARMQEYVTKWRRERYDLFPGYALFLRDDRIRALLKRCTQATAYRADPPRTRLVTRRYETACEDRVIAT